MISPPGFVLMTMKEKKINYVNFGRMLKIAKGRDSLRHKD
jgi:hypothetical protein